jgi:hypothetical protein
VPRSAVGIGMVIGLLVGGFAGAIAGASMGSSVPGLGSAPLILGGFLAALNLVVGAVAASFYNLAIHFIWRRKLPLDGPEADYVDPPIT